MKLELEILREYFQNSDGNRTWHLTHSSYSIEKGLPTVMPMVCHGSLHKPQEEKPDSLRQRSRLEALAKQQSEAYVNSLAEEDKLHNL
uniref:Uncharacterized protein n=1 Tax=Romanomermis culicivorax TaxID=13658 RepID=A0A915KNR5_ROMCU